jgi:hypothetical protein
MEEYTKAKLEADKSEFQQQHIDVATKAIRGEQPLITVTISDKGLEVYSNIHGASLHSMLAMATHTMLGQVPRSDYEVKPNG